MTSLRYSILALILFLFTGCGSGSDDPAAISLDSGNAASNQQQGRVVIQSTLLRAVPTIVEEFQISGFDSNGSLQFGPETVSKAPVVESLMPTAVVRVQINYLVNGQPIGVAELPVTVVANETVTIQEPAFQNTAAALSALSVSTSTVSLAKGTSQPLRVVGNFRSGSQSDFSKLVTWSSSNSTVATVSADGVLQAASEGRATITARFDTLSVAIDLTVTPATVTQLAVTPAPLSLALGTNAQMTATATFTDGTQQDVSATATWLSSAPGVASVHDSGFLETQAEGSATVTASFGGSSADSNVTVTSAELTRIDITPASPSLADGTNQQLTATGVFTDRTTQDLSGLVTWSVADTNVANVTNLGLLTGASVGSTAVSATTAGVTGMTTVTITPAVVTSFVVTPGNPMFPKGTTSQLTATANFSDGTQQDVTSSAAWSSSNTRSVTVSSSGLLTGQDTGTADITAVFSGQTGTLSATVTPAVPVSLSLAPQDLSIALGTAQQYSATVTFSDNSTQDVTSTASWTSSQLGVASITTSGLASSVAEGRTTITASFLGQSASVSLTVTPAEIASVSVTPSNPTIALGTTQQFVAIATLTDNSTQDISGSASWVSSVPGVASVNGTGLANSLSQGQTAVTATAGGRSGSATLIVSAPTVVSLSVTPPVSSRPVGLRQGFSALATFSDSTTQDVTPQATWTSSQVAVATVDTSGLATALSVGSSSIQASFGGQSDSATMTVTAAEISSISLSPSSSTIALGTGQAFVATATLTDSSTQDVTNTASWSSSMPSVATINTMGAATSVSTGTTTITAMTGGVSGSATLTVNPATVVSIAVSPANATITDAQTQQFTAVATFSDNSTQDVTNTASWSSSQPLVASINATGLSSGASAGSATITATTGGQSGTATLTVTSSVTVQSIAVTPGQAVTTPGSSRQYTAIATFSDLTTTDVTSTATWSSSSSDVSVSATGLATVSAGATRGSDVTITATLNSVNGTGTLSVKQIAFVPSSTFGPEAISMESNGSVFSQSSNAVIPGKLIAVHPNGRFFYSVDATSQLIRSYTYDNIGSLTQVGSSVATGEGASDVVIDTSGRFVYVANLGNGSTTFGSVSSFSINPNGSLTSLGTQTYTNNFTADQLSVNDRALYLLDSGSMELVVFSIASNGALTELESESLGAMTNTFQMVADPTNSYLYVSLFNFPANRLELLIYNVNVDGSLTLGRTDILSSEFSSMAINPAGTVLVATDRVNSRVLSHTIGAGGALTQVTSTQIRSVSDPMSNVLAPTKVSIGATGRFVMVITIGDFQVTNFELAGNGSLSQVGGESLFSQPLDLVISP